MKYITTKTRTTTTKTTITETKTTTTTTTITKTTTTTTTTSTTAATATPSKDIKKHSNIFAFSTKLKDLNFYTTLSRNSINCRKIFWASLIYLIFDNFDQCGTFNLVTVKIYCLNMIKFFGLYKVLRWFNQHSIIDNKVQPHNNNNNNTECGNDVSNSKSQITTSTTMTKINVQPTSNKEEANTPTTVVNRENENSSRQNQNQRRRSTKARRSLRLEKVISEIQGLEGKQIDKIKHDIVIQCKSLMKFLGAFILYACSGGVLFFYIEECSGWSNAGDSSIPQIGDRYIEPTYKNLTSTCFELYKNATNATDVNVMHGGHFEIFLSICQTLVKEAANPFVKEGHKQKCVWDEFQLLKYAEYTIFTLLTIGK